MRARIKIAALAMAMLLSLAGWRGLNALFSRDTSQTSAAPAAEQEMPKKAKRTEKEWKQSLTPEQFEVMRKCGTERPFSGQFNDHWQEGVYACAGCDTPLFLSESKYDHGTGWPSFTTPADEKNLEYRDDYSLLMKRVEVRCASCGAHLGHVFDDGPAPTFLHYCINSAALKFVPRGQEAEAGRRREDKGPETATLAGGCFWGVEHRLGKLPGVLTTAVGYTGGRTVNPTYKDVCTDRTGHAEAVELTFDRAKTTYEQVVRHFMSIHDPTSVNRQGPDVGSQYRSAIFYHTEEQRAIARKVMDELASSGRYKKPLATELVPATRFYRAEEYHQKYFEKNGIVCY